jgi:hypothetical protein
MLTLSTGLLDGSSHQLHVLDARVFLGHHNHSVLNSTCVDIGKHVGNVGCSDVTDEKNIADA